MTSCCFLSLQPYPRLHALVSTLLNAWPAHEAHLAKSFADRSAAELEVAESVADLVFRLSRRTPEGMERFCDDYRYFCEELILPEELFFRRHDRYRLSRFEDAERECYSDPLKMTRYMNGVLLSNVFWNNHASALVSYVREYLPQLHADANLLEIGPGHGLFLYFAAQSGHSRRITGWDVSEASLENTRAALSLIGASRKVQLENRSLFGAQGCAESFDGIVMSEILEHVENPGAALRVARSLLRPSGLLWVNMPANSPAPDHIYLMRRPEDALSLVEGAGFAIVSHHFFPMTGYTLEQAGKWNCAISCVVTARNPD